MIREQVRRLWELCFDDSREFTDLYFGLRYSNDVNLAIRSGEEVIAAMQLLPYPMTFAGKEIKTAYVSGACTHPDFRNRGVMRELLSQAFAQMQREGVMLSTLIPASPPLFGYYARSGYAPVFRYREETFVPSPDFSPQTAFTLQKSQQYQPAAYAYLDRKLKERPCCLQHTGNDFRVILADLQLEGGYLYTLSNGEKQMKALAVVWPQNDAWRVEEVVAESPELRHELLERIGSECHAPRLTLHVPPVPGAASYPLGMARIIHAKNVLQRYAATHPELELNLSLTDEQISGNNGYYYLNNGRCMQSTKRLPGLHRSLTIGELAEQLLAPCRPYMSLMLN